VKGWERSLALMERELAAAHQRPPSPQRDRNIERYRRCIALIKKYKDEPWPMSERHGLIFEDEPGDPESEVLE
jgi:hypothetical protein